MRIAVFVVLVALFAALVAAQGSGMQAGREFDLTPEICAKMEGSLLNPFRCADKAPEQLGSAGRSFLAKAKQAAPNLELDPVIILPGLGGSGFEAKLNKKSVPHWYDRS